MTYRNLNQTLFRHVLKQYEQDFSDGAVEYPLRYNVYDRKLHINLTFSFPARVEPLQVKMMLYHYTRERDYEPRWNDEVPRKRATEGRGHAEVSGPCGDDGGVSS